MLVLLQRHLRLNTWADTGLGVGTPSLGIPTTVVSSVQRISATHGLPIPCHLKSEETCLVGEYMKICATTHYCRILTCCYFSGLGERLAIDPNLPTTLYFGARSGNGLWKSTNSGATWAKVTAFPSVGTYVQDPSNEYGADIVVCKTSPLILHITWLIIQFRVFLG